MRIHEIVFVVVWRTELANLYLSNYLEFVRIIID